MFEELIALGRPGGVALLIAAAVCFGFTSWEIQSTGSYFIAVSALGIGFIITGLFLLVFGDPSKRRIRDIVDVPVPPGLAETLAAEPRPFHFCTACYVVAPSARCEGCDRVVPVMEVRDEADIPLALAALEPRGGVKPRKRDRFEVKASTGGASVEVLKGLLESTPRPFHVCTKCCQLGRDGWCDRCDSGLDVLEVRDDEDARMALVSVG